MQFQTKNSKKTDINHLTLCALLVAMSLILSYIEFLLPISIGLPGVKLGLPNIVILISLYNLGFKDAFIINIARICAAGILFSGLFGTIYSLAGGVFSLLIMCLLKRQAERFSIIGVSLAGGVAHNFAQLIVAMLIVQDLKLFIYFPILIFSGLATGILIGFTTYFLQKRIPYLHT